MQTNVGITTRRSAHTAECAVHTCVAFGFHSSPRVHTAAFVFVSAPCGSMGGGGGEGVLTSLVYVTCGMRVSLYKEVGAVMQAMTRSDATRAACNVTQALGDKSEGPRSLTTRPCQSVLVPTTCTYWCDEMGHVALTPY